MLLVRRRNIARAFEQNASRIAFTESASQSEFEIFEAFDRLGAKVRSGPRVLKDACVGELTQPVDRAIQFRGRKSLLRDLLAERLGVVEPLLCFAAELLRIFGRQTSTVRLR